MNREQFDRYLSEHYEALCKYARSFTDCPVDLVHFTYEKMINAGFVYVNRQKTDSYFKLSIKRNAMRGKFRRQYSVSDTPVPELPVDHDSSKVIAREKVEAVVRMLDEFDRLLFELYLEGVNMRKLSRESGIPTTTIYNSIKNTRTTLKKQLG